MVPTRAMPGTGRYHQNEWGAFRLSSQPARADPAEPPSRIGGVRLASNSDISPVNATLQPGNVWIASCAVGLGAALGALLRWQLSLWLNPLHTGVPPGTLAANLIGGYGVGLAIAMFTQHPEWSPAWRLFIITGFLGGLTTFSTFSAEVVSLLQQGRAAAAALAAFTHLAGSVAATVAGLATVEGLRRL